jgi:hypothetical protein
MYCGDDCNDSRANVHPALAEACDGLDNDCDGGADVGLTRVCCDTGVSACTSGAWGECSVTCAQPFPDDEQPEPAITGGCTSGGGANGTGALALLGLLGLARALRLRAR